MCGRAGARMRVWMWWTPGNPLCEHVSAVVFLAFAYVRIRVSATVCPADLCEHVSTVVVFACVCPCDFACVCPCLCLWCCFVQLKPDGSPLEGFLPSGWDTLKIKGCFCDHYFYKGDYREAYTDYTGHDCSLLTCPYGGSLRGWSPALFC